MKTFVKLIALLTLSVNIARADTSAEALSEVWHNAAGQIVSEIALEDSTKITAARQCADTVLIKLGPYWESLADEFKVTAANAYQTEPYARNYFRGKCS